MTCSAGWRSPVFRAERKTEQSGRLEPAFDRKRANLEALAVRHGKTDSSDSTVLSAFCTKNGAGRSGDIGGDKLGGLTDTSAGCRAPSLVLGGLSGREKPCDSGAWASGDEAVTSGDEFSGLEFAGFSGTANVWSFRRKTSELGGSGTTFDV